MTILESAYHQKYAITSLTTVIVVITYHKTNQVCYYYYYCVHHDLGGATRLINKSFFLIDKMAEFEQGCSVSLKYEFWEECQKEIMCKKKGLMPELMSQFFLQLLRNDFENRTDFVKTVCTIHSESLVSSCLLSIWKLF